MPTPLDGRHVLYHYLEKDLQSSDPALFKALLTNMIGRTAIWLSPEIYGRMPLLIPYARRDPLCRGDKRSGRADAWGEPDSQGFFRDDNSLLKRFPGPLNINGPAPGYARRRIGNGWVCAHVWRDLGGGTLASREPLTYSFVPNVVWLPEQVAKLTDREGSFTQQVAQAISWSLYREAPVSGPHAALVEKIWSMLPRPEMPPAMALPDAGALNFFGPDESCFQRRAEKSRLVAQALRGESRKQKVISSRYTAGIPRVKRTAAKRLANFLDDYADGVLAAWSPLPESKAPLPERP